MHIGARVRLILSGILCIGIGGCNIIGPQSIDEGRIRYNSAIQETSQVQLLLNLVRVSQNKTPLFMDVSEVDAAQTLSSSISTMFSGLGIGKKAGAFRMGSLTSAAVTPNLGYSENPTIRYIPLQGQALVQQLATPISIEVLPQLFDSDVPLPTIINFAVDRLTPGWSSYGAALNIFGQLDYMGALTVAATSPAAGDDKSKLAGKINGNSIVVQTTPPAAAPHSSITAYIQPTNMKCEDLYLSALLWRRLLTIYAPVRTKAENDALTGLNTEVGKISGCDGLSTTSLHSPSIPTLIAALQKVPSIELRTESVKANLDPKQPADIASRTPFLRTRSAYGIFRSIDVSDYSPDELISIVPDADYEAIVKMPWNYGKQFNLINFVQYCENGREGDVKCQDVQDIDAEHKGALDVVKLEICLHGFGIIDALERKPKDPELRKAHAHWVEACSFAGKTDAEIKEKFTREEQKRGGEPLLSMSKPLATCKNNLFLGMSLPNAKCKDEEFVQAAERILQKLRRYIVIFKGTNAPSDAFLAVSVGPYDYYIAGDDFVTQRNFRFLSLLSSVQAVAPSAPLTPSISVGAH